MNPLVILNPAASGGRTATRWPQLRTALEAAVGPVEVRETTPVHGAADVTRKALADGYRRLIAVGGDGSVHEVVNGMIDGDKGRPHAADATLSFLMQGTGNDYRRSLTGARTVAEDIAALATDTVRQVDVGRLTYVDDAGATATMLFNNIASFGMSGAVDRRVNNARFSKRLGGTAAFLWATLQTFLTYRNQTVSVSVDDGPPKTLPLRLALVALGRYAGGGMQFAPTARLDDGHFDFIAIRATGRLRTLRRLPLIYTGRHLDLPIVEHGRCRRVHAEPVDGTDVLLDVDGEAPGRLPATFEVIPGALAVRCRRIR